MLYCVLFRVTSSGEGPNLHDNKLNRNIYKIQTVKYLSMDALDRISQPFPPSVHTQCYNAQSVPLTRTWQQHCSIFGMCLYHHNYTQRHTRTITQHAARADCVYS